MTARKQILFWNVDLADAFSRRRTDAALSLGIKTSFPSKSKR